VSEPLHAVFLSYASQDQAAAQRICEALRAAGIEVWFDQSELRGGDIWDQKIRREIRDCALFIPIVSQHTQERLEGYFRREWKLAIERTHDMAEQKHFLVPVVVDSTGDREAIVPDLFRAVQWTRLPQGETPSAFVDRVRRLLSPEASSTIRSSESRDRGAGATKQTSAPAVWPLKKGLLAALVVLIAAAAYFAIERSRTWKSAASSPTVAAGVAAFSPPPHSVAVLPFINMSGDKEQEYFSEGLTEELLNSLAEINGLQVAARTSAFSFEGKGTDIGTIARKLNVGAVLEGSVRRSGNTVRVTTQLINALTGFNLWSDTYDRDLGDVLKLQTEIATAVAGALKVALLGDIASKIELGGTRNSAAFDAYLKGAQALNNSVPNVKLLQNALASFTEALGLDANYALALTGRSMARIDESAYFATGPAIREGFDKALADARHALALAPELPEGQMALARIFMWGSFDFTQASEAWERRAVARAG